jgi:hypothetical protein
LKNRKVASQLAMKVVAMIDLEGPDLKVDNEAIVVDAPWAEEIVETDQEIECPEETIDLETEAPIKTDLVVIFRKMMTIDSTVEMTNSPNAFSSI